MRERFCRLCGNWHSLEAWPSACTPVETARSALPVPFVASDGMRPVQSMLDGKMYDSKSALRATYRAAGMIEVGNDASRLRPKSAPAPDREGIRASLRKASERLNA